MNASLTKLRPNLLSLSIRMALWSRLISAKG